MSSLTNNSEVARATNVIVKRDKVTFELADGRTVSAPVDWYPRLKNGSPGERTNWRFIGRGIGVHWPDLDEDISVENLLRGQPSGESKKSLQRWLNSRKMRVAS